LPISEILRWSPSDQLGAATSLQDEREACPGCGLRPDQHSTVEAVLTSCPGCEARTRTGKQIGKNDVGVRTAFALVDDSRRSVWARFTHRGMTWAQKHRRDPDGLIVDDPADAD